VKKPALRSNNTAQPRLFVDKTLTLAVPHNGNIAQLGRAKR
jgi:hypothetical protein